MPEAMHKAGISKQMMAAALQLRIVSRIDVYFTTCAQDTNWCGGRWHCQRKAGAQCAPTVRAHAPSTRAAAMYTVWLCLGTSKHSQENVGQQSPQRSGPPLQIYSRVPHTAIQTTRFTRLSIDVNKLLVHAPLTFGGCAQYAAFCDVPSM